MQPFRTKRASIVKTEVKWCFLYDDMALAAECSDSYVLMSKRVVNLRFRKFARNLFARNDGRVSKTENSHEVSATLSHGSWRSARMCLSWLCVCVFLCCLSLSVSQILCLSLPASAQNLT